MPRDLVPTRIGPKEEISTELVASKHVYGSTARREERSTEAAGAARKLTSDQARKRDFEQAKQRLKGLNTVSTIDFIGVMPLAVMEMYLLAEEATQNRTEILRMFPKPGTRARERFMSTKAKRQRKSAAVSA